MTNSSTARCLVLIIMLLTLPCSARATVYKMECQEWTVSFGGEVEHIGSYVFSFDAGAKSLSVAYHPEGLLWNDKKIIVLFGAKVKKWNLLWQKEPDVVFWGVDNDFTGPVKLLSLKFSVVKMFEYSLGGSGEELQSKFRSLAPTPAFAPTRRECQRLD
jgi:hypothetical protein